MTSRNVESRREHRSRPRARGLALALGLGGLATSLLVSPTVHAQDAPVVGNGASAATAAASCWEIKQNNPQAASGVYWLITPKLGAPGQFYCDQETDGGGWVLIGRGRENWTQSQMGRLTAADVAQTPTGVAAFSPAQLSADTVNGLLNGGRVDALTEGVRLRRATNTAGSLWQEVRFRYGTARAAWSWQFVGLQQVSNWSFVSTNPTSNVSGNGGTTGSFGNNNNLRRVDTAVDSNNRGWLRGFSFGSAERGNPASSSYVWATSTTTGYPKPFTQVFIRPRLRTPDIFSAIPNGGLPAQTQVATAESYPLASPWGVTGLAAGGTGELNTEVADFAEGNGVMYVAGNFRYVQRDAAGTGRVEQSYLAAFNAVTGEWLSSFRPVINNQVKAVEVLPDGRVAIGGAFTTLNGAPASAFAVVHPVTGATDTSVTTRMINHVGGTPPLIRAMDVQDGYLYIGGRFSHSTGSGVNSEIYMRNLGRLNVSTLSPGIGWNPLLDGTVVSIDASPQGDRVYAAGYFGLSNWTETALRGGVFRTSDASVIPWTINFSNVAGGRLGYQQAVKEVGNRVWIGGAEHMLFSYNRATMQELSTNITQNGGDFQAINTYGDAVAGGCHCSENVYQGARTWPNATGFHRVEHIDQVGMWDASNGEFVPDFSPQLSMREGSGAWAIQEGSNGTLWIGGDFTHARLPNTNNRWTGGFVRFAARDVTPPNTPAGLTVTTTGTTHTLTWQPVAGAATYEVLRNDRVIAVVPGTTAGVSGGGSSSRYFVRAVDAAGNRSATTAVATAGEQPSQPVNVVTAGSQWSYYYESAAPNAAWKTPGFNAASWSTGAAPLGWGHSNLGTTLNFVGTRPLTSYYRSTFNVQNAAAVASMTLTTRADDGIAVYVNGVEVGRSNLPAGVIGHETYATAAPNAAVALANPVTYTVPGSLLQTGQNVITAEVHSNYRATPSASFELTATLTNNPTP